MTEKEFVDEYCKIEDFMTKEWIPAYINEIVNNIHKGECLGVYFPIQHGKREEFETNLKKLLTTFDDRVQIKKLKLILAKLKEVDN